MHSPWDDIRYVLAVAQSGTVSGAARDLEVNHATVLRRVAAFEARIGRAVFERGPHGYAILPEQLPLVDALREVEHAVVRFEAVATGAAPGLRGDIRVTSTDTLCQTVLPELIEGIQARSPELRVSLLATNRHVDLARLNAEIAVRPARMLDDELDGVRAAELGFAVYAREDCRGGWLEPVGRLARSGVAEWVRTRAEPPQIRGRADSFPVLATMAARGIGQTVLPCIMAENFPELRRRAYRPLPAAMPVWVACHRELAEVPRIAALRRFLADAIEANADRLSGDAAKS